MAPRARLTSRAMNIVRRPARDPSRLLEATLGPRVGLKPVYLCAYHPPHLHLHPLSLQHN